MRLLALVLLLFTSCTTDQTKPATGLNDPPKLDRTLRVLTRYSPTTYYIGRGDEPQGFEYELASHFANFVGAKLKVEVANSPSDILTAIDKGKIDFAAAGITRTEEREKKYLFGPDYLTVRQQLVCHKGGPNPRTIPEMVGIDLLVPTKTSYVDTLKRLQSLHPDLTWKTADELSTEQIIEKVWKKGIGCTVADSTIFQINHRYFPELRVTLSTTKRQPLAWPLPPSKKELRDHLNSWFARIETQETLRHLEEKYFGFVELFDYVDVKAFKRKVRTTLPKYEKAFREEAKKHGFAWTLLAAQAYQESRWSPDAKSPTGVRGLMMLTQNTATSLGITDRLDPLQSIEGGARYLQKMRKRIPEEIPEPKRTWFALAAYNVGFAHLRDARELTKRLHKEPNVWSDVQTVLPYLSQQQYYRTLKYGYARGTEPVQYVQRIRNYEDLLLQQLGKR